MDHPPQPTLPQVDPLHPLTSLEWRECGRLPEAVSYNHEAIVVGNKVYMGRCKTTASIYIHDLITETWRTITSPCSGSALTAYQERLVLLGGWDPYTVTPTNQLWMMEEEGTWTQPLPPMPTPRWMASAATIQNNLIVAGGYGSQGEFLDVVEVYNGRQWMTAQSLPRSCSVMKSAIHNGIWYLVGGHSQGREVWCASLESLVASSQSEVTETVWKTLPEVHHARSSTAVWGGHLMAMGGILSHSDILSYSPHTQSWVKVGELPGFNLICATVLPTGELLVVEGLGSGRVVKGSLRVNQFQPATSFDITVLECMETCIGINIFREVAPKYQWLMGSILLHINLAKEAIRIQSPVERIKFIFGQWLAGKSHLHQSATWEMLFKLLWDMELGWLAQEMEDYLRMVPGRAVAGPDHSRREEVEGEGWLEQGEGGVEEVGGAEGKEQEGCSDEDTKPGAGVQQEVGVAKWEGGAEEEPLKMKQEQDLVSMLEKRVAKREEQLLQCEETIQMYKKVAKREEQLLQCEETIQMYKERHQKQLQQMESVMAENEQLRKQIRPVEEGALVPAGESATAGYLRGVDVIGETTLSVTNEAQTFHWTGYGLKLHIPPASLPTGVGQSSIDIKASLAGQFNFPENTILVSAVYSLHSPVEFSQPIPVEIQHCITPSDDPSLTFARASEKEPPYQFTTLEGGLFPTDSCYACTQLNRFSLVAIIQKLWSLLTLRQPERQYCAQVYYTKETENTWWLHFVVTHNLEAYVTTVRERYSGALAGPQLDVIFEDEEIVLQVPREGITVNDNWTITPLAYPSVAKKLVDSFDSGGWLPSCQLRIKRRGKGRLEDLEYTVRLKGAKEPRDFFLIALECDSTPKDVSPPSQRTSVRSSHQYTSGVVDNIAGPSTSRDGDVVQRSSRRRSSRKRSQEHTGGEGAGLGAEEAPSDLKRPRSEALPYTTELRAEPELPDFMNLVAVHIPSKWRLVGIQLHLKDSDLDCIQVISNEPLDCFSSVFTLWKRKETKLPLSWWTVLQALETASVSEQRLARQVRSKLTTPSHD